MFYNYKYNMLYGCKYIVLDEFWIRSIDQLGTLQALVNIGLFDDIIILLGVQSGSYK